MENENRSKILYCLGKACATWRVDNGITQRQIAKALGCSVNNISTFELGKNDSMLIFMYYVAIGFDPMESGLAWQALKSY